MQDIYRPKLIDQNNHALLELKSRENCAEIALGLGKVTMNFASIERVPRFANGERETDVEHSFMLALVAPELSEAIEMPLSSGLVTQFALVHDLIELKTGDVATFTLSADELVAKEHAEQNALTSLLAELPPHTAQLLERYELQAEPEARFVRMVDKLLPLIVDIIGDGARVMHEDYAITTSEQLAVCHEQLHGRLVEKFGAEFPELLVAHQILSEVFKTTFRLS